MKSKKMGLAFLLVFFGVTSLVADGDPALEALKRIKALEGRMDKVEQSRAEIDETDEYLEGRIDEVETIALTDKIRFGLGVETTVENFTRTLGDGSSSTDANIWSSKLNLNMSAEITEKMIFNGRLSMNKYWANSVRNTMSYSDPMQGRLPADSSVFMERAYIDWVLMDGEVPVIVTIGRQPSSEGPSHQFKNNTVRKSTYSALAFDGAADGLVTTVNLSNVIGFSEDKEDALRIAYGKGYQDESIQSFTGVSNSPLEDTNILGVFLDLGIPGIKGSLLQFGYVTAKDMVANQLHEMQTMGDKTGNGNLGDFNIFGFMAEFTNIEDVGLDLFAHIGFSEATPNGNTYFMDSNGNGVVDPGEVHGLMFTDMGNDSDLETKRGHAYWVGGRYKIPGTSFKIGAEYNYGSKYWFSFNQGSGPVNKLATRGSAKEAYVIYDINRYANLKIGALLVDYEYTGSGYHIGAPMEIENNPMMAGQLSELTNLYATFRILF